MISIEKQNDTFVFNVNGMHKLWAFKSELTIPADNIKSVHQDHESIKGWKGWRAPGTHLPSILVAGTFHKDGNKIFWDVMNIDNCIIVELIDEEYKQLIIEVENPKEAMALLQGS